jgi:serine/threonine protein kinase
MREQRGPIQERDNLTGDQKARVSAAELHFGNYDLVDRIDVGGMGEVYLARQRTAFGRLVAIKIIRSDLVHDVVARQRFLREAEVSAHLKHEHILPLVEFGEEQGRLFLVTPYIEGGTLAQRLQRGPLSLSEIHQLFSAMVRAIAYIHRRGVVHRDLKPSNILLDQEAESDQIYVRLIDFGIASLQGDITSPPLTTAGNEMGTVAYMAPERLSGVAAPSNDIYSLGIILYQMITGHLPTSGKRFSLPVPLETVVQRCTALDPLDRYATADELLKAFEQACQIMRSAAHIHAPLAPEDADDDDDPTPRHLTSQRTQQTPPAWQDSLILRPVGADGVSVHTDAVFKPRDYGAPTTFIDPSHLERISLHEEEVIAPVPLKKQRKRHHSVFSFITIAIVLILFLMAGIIFVTFEAGVSATVSITPQVYSISTVLTMQAQPQLHSINVANEAIPAASIQESKTASRQGPTTQPSDCFIAVFCQRVVTPNDANTLAMQLQSSLQTQLTNDIQQQLAVKHATIIGSIQFTETAAQANPPIGTRSDTVTVTLTEQGAAEYLLASDAQTLARLLLQQKVQQQYGNHYVLLRQLMQIGQPVIETVDVSGNVTLSVAAAGVAEYQIPQSQLTEIQNHLKGMKLLQANTYLTHQPGINPNAVIIHLSYGDTLPANVAQIRLVHLNPATLPSVQLPQVTPTGVYPISTVVSSP